MACALSQGNLAKLYPIAIGVGTFGFVTLGTFHNLCYQLSEGVPRMS
jgi:hypothetical protein